MCIISCLVKWVLGIVYSLLLIMGIVLAVIGGLLLWAFQAVLKGLYSIETDIDTFMKKFGIQVDSHKVISLISNNSTSIGAIAFGIGIILIAFAICGIIFIICCSLKLIFIVILILLIVLTFGLIGLVVYYGADTETRVLTPIENVLKTKIVEKYISFKSTEPESILINIIQITGHCCGVYNSSDYDTVTSFNKTFNNSKGEFKMLKFPYSCCEFSNDFTIKTDVSDNCIDNGESKYKSTGCWSKIRPELAKYLQYSFTSLGITIGILIASIISTIILIQCADKLDI